jgi:hypothetical protein
MLIAQKNISFFVIVSLAIVATAHASLFDQIRKEIHDMEVRMQQCFAQQHEINKNSWKQFDIAMEQATIAIAENKNAHKVDVVICPLAIAEPTPEAFEPSFDPGSNTLEVRTPVGKIMLQAEHHMVCVSFDHQVQKEQQDGKSTVMMSSYNQAVTKVSNEIALEETTIEYDPETKKLTISVPGRKKATMKIPVTVKEIAKK